MANSDDQLVQLVAAGNSQGLGGLLYDRHVFECFKTRSIPAASTGKINRRLMQACLPFRPYRAGDGWLTGADAVDGGDQHPVRRAVREPVDCGEGAGDG